jgi:hypothetical protein
VPVAHPGASRRSISLARFARHGQTSDALRRENAKAWLFEIRMTDLVFRARCRTGTVPNTGVRYGPGSAALREELRAAPCPGQDALAPPVIRRTP